ncbi:uncharacterized protein NCBP2-AS2 homolog [Diachasma alloeum]|uniref:uncharacterized protein NCBP2-AS2 homolog n=1 Tax=Diachasma alloeum TaxID=454923 RepID=UPI00073814B6|nr:uncharacterized protein NCBP2-AS2 homolog [Diachasma alloeum]
MLRFLMRYLANNERLVSKLAESKPMRRAAQFVVYIWLRTKSIHGAQKLSADPREFAAQLRNIARKYASNIKEGIEDAKRELKKK